MPREVAPLETEFNGITFRSRTEARWAVFFEALGLEFSYEPKTIKLSSGVTYLPDFYIGDFDAYFEVKPNNEDIVTEECIKARQLAADLKGQRVWLAMGAPSSEEPNILPLDQWPADTLIDEILSTTENRYYFLGDRRDKEIYWLQANDISGSFFRHCFCVGGPGQSTDHLREPIMEEQVQSAYQTAAEAFK